MSSRGNQARRATLQRLYGPRALQERQAKANKVKKVRGKEAAPTMRGPGEAEMEAAGKSVYQVQFDELSCLSVPPARELRDLHKDLWLRFGKEESSTIKRLASVQERLKQQQESLADLEVGSSGPTHPVKVERVKYLTREIQAAIRKTKAWNTGQLEGLDRSQTALEEEVEGIERSLASVRLELEDVEAAARAAEAKEEMEKEEDPVVEEYEEDFHLWLSRAGGPSGGWTHDDHLVLTTLTHRHANWRRKTNRFIEEVWSAVKAVPNREEVRRHTDWYVEYCARRDKQKEKIGQWRMSRIMKTEKELNKKYSGKGNSAPSTPKPVAKKGNWVQKNKERLKKLEEWKKLKAVKKEIEEAENLLRIAEKKSKIEERMDRRNKQIKEYLKAREDKKRAQQEKEDTIRRIKDMQVKQRREINRMVLSQYHDKDMERIQGKIKQKAEEQERKEERRRREQEKLTRPVVARRELDSVFRSTLASSNRAAATKERIDLLFPPPDSRPPLERRRSDCDFARRRSFDGGDIYHLDNLPKLASPQWRTLV